MLDDRQNRQNNSTPVEQAFSYASKSGGNCTWVIVSNILETRFYHSLDQSKYQVYFLKDLTDENKLKELLYLFHKDRLIKEEAESSTTKLLNYTKTQSPSTSKTIHIIDQLDNCSAIVK